MTSTTKSTNASSGPSGTAGPADELADLAELRSRLKRLESAQRKGRRRRWRTVLLSSAGIVAATAAGTLAYASIPSADGTVTACVTSPAGSVRIIDTGAGQTCLASETKVQWGAGMHDRGNFNYSTTYQVGDVAYIGSTYIDATGRCPVSTGAGARVPAGSWVRLTPPTTVYSGGYYVEDSPCMANTNWALVAKDGAAGATGATGPQGPAGPQGPQGQPGTSNAHWAVIGADNTVTASGDGVSNVYVYPYQTGRTYIYFGRVADVAKCGVNVTAQDPSAMTSQPVNASFQRYYGWIVVETTTTSGAWIAAETDITVNCPTAS